MADPPGSRYPARPVRAGDAGPGRVTALLALAWLTLLWGGNWPAIKLALTGIPPWTFRTLCLVVGGLGLLGLARLRNQPLALPAAERAPLMLIALLNITAWHLLSAFGIARIQAGRAAIIGYTMPLWTVLLGRLVLGERLTARRVLALLLGLLALLALLRPAAGRLVEAPLGALAILLAAATWALGTVIMKRRTFSLPVLPLTAWQVLLGGLPVLIGAFVLESPWQLAWPGPRAAAGAAYSTLVGVVVCHSLWFWLVGVLPAGVAALATLGVPVVGVFSSAWILGESLGVAEGLALVLVVSAVALVVAPAPAERAR